MDALRVLLGEIGEEAGVQDRPVGRRHDPHHGPVDLGHVGVGAVHERHFVRVQNNARPHGVDADQVDERLHDHRVVAAARVLPHLLQHLIGLDGDGLIHAPARRRIEAVRHGDDLGIDRENARANRLGIAGQVDLHVVLVSNHHAAVGDLAVAAQPEERQDAEPGVRLHDAPLLFGESPFLIQYLERHAGFADVVKQRRHAEIVELELGQSQLAS